MICLMVLLLAAATAGAADCLSRADSLIGAGNLDQAIGLLRQAAAKDSVNDQIFVKLGQAVGQKSGKDFEAGKMNEAMNGVSESFGFLDKAIFLNENNIEARLTYAIMGMQIPPFFGKLKPSVQHLEKARSILEANPTKENESARMAVYRYLGEGYQKQERYREAEICWKIGLTVSGEGEHAEAMKRGLEALKDKVKDTTLQQNDPDIPETKDVVLLMKQGRSLLAQEKYAKARTVFEKVMALDEKNADAQLLLIQAVSCDAAGDYDERVYDNQDTRTHLAFDMVRELEKGVQLMPDNYTLKLRYALSCIYMPFFVGKIDAGLAALEELTGDEAVPDSVKQEAMFGLGFGYMKKGNACWAKLVQSDQASQSAAQIYEYYGMRQSGPDRKADGDHVRISFHLGFMDELAPQTALWITDAEDRFVKTVYISGFAGHAREKQVTLRKWGESTNFETDGTTSASIDWGTHTYIWDLTDHEGKKVGKGTYKVWLEVSWWPTFRYTLMNAEIQVGKKEAHVVTEKKPFVPMMKVKYIKK